MCWEGWNSRSGVDQLTPRERGVGGVRASTNATLDSPPPPPQIAGIGPSLPDSAPGLPRRPMHTSRAPDPASFRSSAWVFVTLAGAVCALTLLFLGMRGVMEVGGACAEGNAPYVIAQPCPPGTFASTSRRRLRRAALPGAVRLAHEHGADPVPHRPRLARPLPLAGVELRRVRPPTAVRRGSGVGMDDRGCRLLRHRRGSPGVPRPVPLSPGVRAVHRSGPPRPGPPRSHVPVRTPGPRRETGRRSRPRWWTRTGRPDRWCTRSSASRSSTAPACSTTPSSRRPSAASSRRRTVPDDATGDVLAAPPGERRSRRGSGRASWSTASSPPDASTRPRPSPPAPVPQTPTP
jgi:hypothetical protein